MATTPLEREILTHYATTAGPYRGGSENWLETHVQIVRRFLDLGLLISHTGADGLQRIGQNEEALRIYMAALAAVPLPVQQWVVPSTRDAFESRDGGGSGDSVARGDDTQARVAELERQVRALQTDESGPRRERYGLEED
jgi:hypothetical protein